VADCLRQPYEIEEGAAHRCPDCDKRCCGGKKTGNTNRPTGNSSPWCHNPPGMKTEHKSVGRCYLHGGNTATVRKAAEAALQRRTLARLENDINLRLEAEGIEPIGDPFDALEDLAARAFAFQRVCADRVANLKGEWRYQSTQGTEQIRGEVEVFERSLDRCAKFVDLIARLGLDERRVQVTEMQAVLLDRVLRNVLVAVGVQITPEVDDVIHRQLVEVADVAALDPPAD